MENLRWIRQGEENNLYQWWVLNPCHATCGGREKKRLLLETIVTRKADLNSLISCRAFDRSREDGRQIFSSKGRKENSRIFCFI